MENKKPCLPFGEQGWKSLVCGLDRFLLLASGFKDCAPANKTAAQAEHNATVVSHRSFNGGSSAHERGGTMDPLEILVKMDR